MPRRRHWTQHPPFGILGFCCSGQGGIIDFSLSKPGFSMARGQHRPPGSQHPVLIPTIAIALHSSSSEGLYTNMAPFKSCRLSFACQWAPIARTLLSPLPASWMGSQCRDYNIRSRNPCLILFLSLGPRPTGCLPATVTLAIGEQGASLSLCPWLRSCCSKNSVTSR